MCYQSWPDHGVPDHPDEFIEFAVKIRKIRQVSILLSTLIWYCMFTVGLGYLIWNFNKLWWGGGGL